MDGSGVFSFSIHFIVFLFFFSSTIYKKVAFGFLFDTQFSDLHPVRNDKQTEQTVVHLSWIFTWALSAVQYNI